MESESFYASRWTKNNLFFPTELEVNEISIVRRKRSFFSMDEETMHLNRIASVRIVTGPLFSTIIIESTGGTDPIVCQGHHKEDALRIKELIEEALEGYQPPRNHEDTIDMRTCPFCAEDIRAAAVICRYCGRELPA